MFRVNLCNSALDADECDQLKFDQMPSDLFQHIVMFALRNAPSSTLQRLRTVSKSVYSLCSDLQQKRLFDAVDSATTTLINGLSRVKFVHNYMHNMLMIKL